MKILIIGGTGTISSAITRQLAAAGHDLWLLKKKDIRLRERGPYFMERVKIFEEKVGEQLAPLTIQRGGPMLSRREREVLRLIAQGRSTKEIALQLFISENTVETHRQNLFAKLGVHNMADLLIKAIAVGYINPQEYMNKMKL